MTLETKTNLNVETIDKLQKLIRANLDSYYGLHESAKDIADQGLKSLFKQLGDERWAMAAELQDLVEFNGEEAVDDGSVAALTHRVWLNIRALLNNGDPYVILIEAERGEDHIMAAYEEVLKATAGSALNDALLAQYSRVKTGHDQLRDLRDSYKPK